MNRLSFCSIKLRDLEDELVWSHNPKGVYTESTVYRAMFLAEPQEIVSGENQFVKLKLL